MSEADGENGWVWKLAEEAGVTLLKMSGDNVIGTCPFHQDHKRSFSINSDTGQYICFSESCGASGGLYSFLVEALHYSKDRAKKLAEEYGAFAAQKRAEGWPEAKDWKDRRKKKADPKDKTVVMDEALLGIYDFCPKYMLKRGFSKATLKAWEVGFDHDSERVVLPVRDQLGRLVGLSKRTTKNEDPKYLHLNFQKNRHLYGLHRIEHRNDTIVVEGQTDHLAVWQALQLCPELRDHVGVVSTMGARVSKEQVDKLARFKRVILAFDAEVVKDNRKVDRDGLMATVKVGDDLLSRGHRGVFALRKYGKAKDVGEYLAEDARTDEAKVRRIRKLLDTIQPWSVLRVVARPRRRAVVAFL